MEKESKGIDVTPDTILEGETTFEVGNGMDSYTFKVYKAKPTAQFPGPAYFAKIVFPGSHRDHHYIGKVEMPNDPARDPELVLTGRSCYSEEHRRVQILKWALKAIWQTARGQYALPPGYKIVKVGEVHGTEGRKGSDRETTTAGN